MSSAREKAVSRAAAWAYVHLRPSPMVWPALALLIVGSTRGSAANLLLIIGWIAVVHHVLVSWLHGQLQDGLAAARRRLVATLDTGHAFSTLAAFATLAVDATYLICWIDFLGWESGTEWTGGAGKLYVALLVAGTFYVLLQAARNVLFATMVYRSLETDFLAFAIGGPMTDTPPVVRSTSSDTFVWSPWRPYRHFTLGDTTAAKGKASGPEDYLTSSSTLF